MQTNVLRVLLTVLKEGLNQLTSKEGQTDMNEATIYIGTPEALQAEIGLLPCYTGPYVVAAFNAAGEQITPEISDSVAGAKACAAEIGDWLRGLGQTVTISWIV